MSGRKPIIINGTNPYWIIEAAEAMFDQTSLFETEKFLPTLKFQNTILIMTTLYRFVKISAPSQSGKTTTAEILGAVLAYAFPGSKGLILSTEQDQSKRLLLDVKEKLIQCHKVPELRSLSVDNDHHLVIKETRSSIRALPHSIKAVTGNPADWIILDEMEKWDKEPAKIYAEALARTGKTGGTLLVISTVDQEGKSDPRSPEGYTGSFFYQMWHTDFVNRKLPEKSTIAARFTYHVSKFLLANIEPIRQEMISANMEPYFRAHYLGIPRKAKGQPCFGSFFKRSIHVKPEQELPINPQETLALCFDPGLEKAAVLMQLDTSVPRLIYLRAYKGDRTQLFETFVQSVHIQVRKAFPNFDVQYFADVASKKVNDQTLVANADIMARITHQYPVMEYQAVIVGIQIIKSFMRMMDGFYISDKCEFIADMFESGLVSKVVNGVATEEYEKDGVWDHLGDSARYPVAYLTGDQSAQSLNQQESYELSMSEHINSVTGY